MEGRIILTCGHEDETRPSGWPLTEKDGEGVSESGVCLECYIRALQSHPQDILFGEYEVAEHLGTLRQLELQRIEESERAALARLKAKYDSA